MGILSWIKRTFILGGIVLGHSLLYGQNKLTEEYLKEVGDHAAIYSGEVETIYNPFLFENDPYYISEKYADGEIFYRGNLYPNQRMRLDLYQGRLILLTPKTNLGIVLNPAHVNKVRMHDKTIIYHTPPQETGLREGYYLLLHDGNALRLLGRQTIVVENINGKIEKLFVRHNRYYLVQNGIYHPVKNRQSFSKLFPEYKKQIKRFAKESELNWKKDRENSLVKLARFCEEIN